MKNRKHCNLLCILFLVWICFPFQLAYSQNPTFTSSAATVCINQQLSFTNTSLSGVFSEFNWDFNGDGTYDMPGTEGGTVTFTYAGYFQGNVFLWGKKISDGAWALGGQQIKVYAPNTPAMAQLPSIVCKGEVMLTNTSTINNDGSGHLIIWDFGDGSPGVETNQLSVNHEFILDGMLTITMTDSNTCGSNSASSEININLLSTQIVSSSFDTICQGEPVEFSNMDDSPNMTYTWNFGDGSPVSRRVRPIHRYLTDGNFRVLLQVEIPDGIGCNDNDSLDVFVLPGPIAEFISSFPAGNCDSAYINFNDLSKEVIPGDTYLWDFGNGDTLNSATLPGPVFYDSSGYYYPVLRITRSGNACFTEYNDTILIPQTPQVFFKADKVCLGQSASFMDLTPACVPVANNFSWDFGDGTADTVQNPGHIYNLSGDMSVIFSTGNGYCSKDTTLVVTVEDLPHPAFELNTYKGCSALNIITNNQTTDGSEYIWNFGDLISLVARDTSYAIENPSDHDTTIDVTLITSTTFGCMDSISRSVKVFVTPVAVFSSDTQQLPVCVPDTVTFTSLTKGSSSIEWDFGDNTTSTDSTITHIFENEQHYFRYYTVNLISHSDSGCSDTATQYITLYPKPDTDFAMDTLTPMCSATRILFTAPAENLGFYAWIFEPPDTVKSTDWHASYVFINSGKRDTIFPVQLITENRFGCFGDTIKNLTVPPLPPPPAVNFLPDPDSGCPELEVNFQNTSKFTDTTSYVWDFGDGTHSYEINPVHTYLDGGNKTVQLTAKGLDCRDTLKMETIQVFEMPSAIFDIIPDTAWIPDNPVLCSPVYQDASWQYSWDFGDGANSDTMEVLHYYADTTTHTISLKVLSENGCSASYSKNISGKTAGSIISPNVFFPPSGRSAGGGGYGDGSGAVGFGDDVFAPVTEGVAEYHLEVYDRWGERLFHSDSKEIGWTGYYHGILCKEDVYIWKVFGKYSNNLKFIKAGTITLLHQ